MELSSEPNHLIQILGCVTGPQSLSLLKGYIEQSVCQGISIQAIYDT